MEKNGVLVDLTDLRLFDENRTKFTPDQLAAYAGRHVAWSMDGKRVVAAGNTRQELDDRLESMGIHFSQVVHDYIDTPLD